MEEEKVLIKLVSIGDPQVGKSCIIKRYCEGRFVSKYVTTIGIDYGVKPIKMAGKDVAINFFDLSGDEAYEQVRNPFFKDSQIVLLVFDLDNVTSFSNIKKWQKVMKQNGVDFLTTVIMLVGNKADLKSRNTLKDEATQYAKTKKYEYVQTSANTGDGINELFDRALKKAMAKIDQARRELKA